jgi:hypothetical protein
LRQIRVELSTHGALAARPVFDSGRIDGPPPAVRVVE